MADATNYLLDGDVEAGDELRVRPWTPPAKTFGQGKNTGPVLNGEKYDWGQPVVVDDHNIDTINRHRDLFMTESAYQDYQSEIQSD